MNAFVTEKNRASFAQIQRKTRMALHQLLTARLLDILATFSSPLHTDLDTFPFYILFRGKLSKDWVVKDSRSLLRSLRQQRTLALAPPFEVDVFHGLAAKARLLYAGANVDTLGTETAHHYRMDSTLVPFFPEEQSVRQRLCYWKWSPNGTVTDVLASSLDGLLLLLLEVYKFPDPMDPFIYSSAFRLMNGDCVVPFVSSTHLYDTQSSTAFTGYTDDMHARVMSAFKTSASSSFLASARPLCLADYKALGVQSNCVYVGCFLCYSFEIGVRLIPECSLDLFIGRVTTSPLLFAEFYVLTFYLFAPLFICCVCTLLPSSFFNCSLCFPIVFFFPPNGAC